MRRILLATERHPFSADALAQTAALAEAHGAKIVVLVIMRIWGSGLGVPHPGLLPNARERETAKAIALEAVEHFERRGLDAVGDVVGTRRAAKVICRTAVERQCDLVVMAAPRRGGVTDFLWRNEPYRVARFATVPVLLVKQRS